MVISSKNNIHEVLEILSVTPALENSTGNQVYQIVFARTLKIDQELAKYINPIANSKPPKMVSINDIILYVKMEDMAPYIVGSKWNLDINSGGKLSLEKVE